MQECTALSTIEVEYVAASEAIKQSILLLYRLSNRIDHPTSTLYIDSQSAIHLIRNPIYHAKKKYFEVRFPHILELVTEKKLEVQKIDTEINISDCLTKLLPELHFGALRNTMGLRQGTGQKRAEQENATGKSSIDLAKHAKKAKSKELENRKAKDATECEEED